MWSMWPMCSLYCSAVYVVRGRPYSAAVVVWPAPGAPGARLCLFSAAPGICARLRPSLLLCASVPSCRLLLLCGLWCVLVCVYGARYFLPSCALCGPPVVWCIVCRYGVGVCGLCPVCCGALCGPLRAVCLCRVFIVPRRFWASVGRPGALWASFCCACLLTGRK